MGSQAAAITQRAMQEGLILAVGNAACDAYGKLVEANLEEFSFGCRVNLSFHTSDGSEIIVDDNYGYIQRDPRCRQVACTMAPRDTPATSVPDKYRASDALLEVGRRAYVKAHRALVNACVDFIDLRMEFANNRNGTTIQIGADALFIVYNSDDEVIDSSDLR